MKTRIIRYKADKCLFNMIYKHFDAMKCQFSSKNNEKFKRNQKNQLFLKIDCCDLSNIYIYMI